MNDIAVPTADECYAIMAEEGMLPNIIDHSKQVCRVALAIFDHSGYGQSMDRDIVVSAALLHDIGKTISLQTKRPRHDLIGGEILRDRGYIRVAEIVEAHIFLEGFTMEGPPREEELIYYSDKRVMHDKIVSVDERIDDIRKRYARFFTDRNKAEKNRRAILSVGQKLQRCCREDIDGLLSCL